VHLSEVTKIEGAGPQRCVTSTMRFRRIAGVSAAITPGLSTAPVPVTQIRSTCTQLTASRGIEELWRWQPELGVAAFRQARHRFEHLGLDRVRAVIVGDLLTANGLTRCCGHQTWGQSRSANALLAPSTATLTLPSRPQSAPSIAVTPKAAIGIEEVGSSSTAQAESAQARLTSRTEK